MTERWIGDLVTDRDSGCLYSPTPADPMCGRPATRHVATYSHPWEQIVALPTCDEHEPIAKACGRFYRAHDWDSTTCGLPNAGWLFDGGTRCVPMTVVAS